ncbi:MAG: hypothetical protein NTV22_18555 [bacterium]|nr:hypothetical protein [bacterium]
MKATLTLAIGALMLAGCANFVTVLDEDNRPVPDAFVVARVRYGLQLDKSIAKTDSKGKMGSGVHN